MKIYRSFQKPVLKFLLKESFKNVHSGSFFFRIPKLEDHFTGHRFEISSNGFLHVIGNCLVRALKVCFGGTGNRKCLKKIIL